MRKMAFEVKDKTESEIIQKNLFKAGGTWSDSTVKIKNTNDKYIFISEDLVITTSSDSNSFNLRVVDLITISEAVIILESLFEKQPFLNRSGIKTNYPLKIDSYLRDQYKTVLDHNGIDFNKRVENLIAADIYARLNNLDLIGIIKSFFLVD